MKVRLLVSAWTFLPSSASASRQPFWCNFLVIYLVVAELMLSGSSIWHLCVCMCITYSCNVCSSSILIYRQFCDWGAQVDPITSPRRVVLLQGFFMYLESSRKAVEISKDHDFMYLEISRKAVEIFTDQDCTTNFLLFKQFLRYGAASKIFFKWKISVNWPLHIYTRSHYWIERQIAILSAQSLKFRNTVDSTQFPAHQGPEFFKLCFFFMGILTTWSVGRNLFVLGSTTSFRPFTPFQ